MVDLLLLDGGVGGEQGLMSKGWDVGWDLVCLGWFVKGFYINIM